MMMMMVMRYRSRLVTSKQAKVADHNSSITSPTTQDQPIPVSPFSNQTCFLRGFVYETVFEAKAEAEAKTDSLLSTVSLFKTSPMFSFGKPIWYDNLFKHKSPKKFPENKQYAMENIDKIHIGDSIVPEKTPQDCSNKLSNRLVTSELRNWRLETHVSTKGMFDSGGTHSASEVKRQRDNTFMISKESFLNFCYTCKKQLGQGIDIYIYKGEKAFCSAECRCQEMLLDGVENSEF